MKRRYLALIILSVITLASWWLLQPTVQTAKENNGAQITDGYYLLNAQISDFDTDGRTQYSLIAARIDHSPLDESVQLEELKISYSQNDKLVSSTPTSSEHADQMNASPAAVAPAGWTISATRGSMGASRDRLTLLGQVRIVGQMESQKYETIISTDRLILDIPTNQASTTDEVRIELAGNLLTATGMQADLNAQSFSLLSNVRGKFEANK